MHKKIMLACMAITAFAAFVIAPTASASPVLTENGSALAVGASIKGTNISETLFTASTGAIVRCTKAELKGSVTGNSGTVIKGTIPVGGAVFSGTGVGSPVADCTSDLGDVRVTVTSELCLETVTKSDNVTITGCSGNPVTFTLHITNTGSECKYSTSTVLGTFVTNASATVKVTEQSAGLVSGFLCPSSGKLDMHFDLTTTDGTALLVS
jgi:hypothetical protein